MNDYQNHIAKNLSSVDSTIQKLLGVQLIAIVIYGLLFLDGLAIKREIDELQGLLEETNELSSRFSWLDSLSFVFTRRPELGQQYQIYLEQFQKRLDQLQDIVPHSYYRNAVDNTFRLDYPEWSRVRSQDIIDHVKILADTGRKIIGQKKWLLDRLRRLPRIDTLNLVIKIRKHLEPLPALYDTLGPLVDKVFPEDAGLYKNLCSLDSLTIQRHLMKWPSPTSLEKDINDVLLHYQSHDIESHNLSGLDSLQNALDDSIRARENQKGKMKFAFIEQPVSVKVAFYVALPILIFFNHLLLLFLRKKGHLHREFEKSISPKIEEGDPQRSDKLSIYLSPSLVNFLYTQDTSKLLRFMTWVFFILFEVAVGVLGLVIFRYLWTFLPTAERSSLITLAFIGFFLLIYEIQVLFIFVRAIKISI